MSASSAAPRRAPHYSRVLVVDPDADTRALYRESLRNVGCDVVEAEDGREALVQALVHAPTVIVTETRLPFLDGYALCDILRRDSATRTIPIVVVTSESRQAQLARVRAAGADAVLVKPAPVDALMTEIQRVLTGERPQPGSAASTAPQPTSPIGKRTPLSKAHERHETTTPRRRPVDLRCPTCDRVLEYQRTYIGGVNERQAEQWDRLSCSCGDIFEYRHRTRKLRRLR